LGHEVSAVTVASRYRGLLSGMVIDEADAGLAVQIEALGLAVRVLPTLMRSAADRRALAQACLDFAGSLASAPRAR
jgi:LPPG:FO 2-phospho-L-lactate transferase